MCSVHRSGENMMPTDLELNRIINNIQELLYSASDVSHDRCVKVLTARAKVRDWRRPLMTTSSKGPGFNLGSEKRFPPVVSV